MRPHIHPSAIVSVNAIIEPDTKIGPFTIIHDNVHIKSGTVIEAYCEIGIPSRLSTGAPLIIGKNSLVRSHSVLYESSEFGEGLVTGHHVVIRENTKAGDGFQIGTNSEVQGDCEIGNYVKFQSQVLVGKYTKIGNFVWVYPNVVFTNDPTPPSENLIGGVVEDYAVIATGSIILPGVVVGEGSLVGVSSVVSKNTAPHKIYYNVRTPRNNRGVSILKDKTTNTSAYPWTKRYKRNYPKHITDEWSND